jgi:hypothetical protein
MGSGFSAKKIKVENKKKEFVILLIFVIIGMMVFCFLDFVNAVKPYGANVSHVKTETAPLDDPVGMNAQAGNVTELNIFGYTTTQAWQGYFGNVTGTVQLGDASDNILYNWSVVSPRGEIYASTNDSVQWGFIHCFNFTATGTYADDSANVGNTSLFGMNLSQLESNFNINATDVDGVDETFNLIGAGTHDRFYTANNEFSEGECRNTRVFSNAGQGENNKFEEVLLYDSNRRAVVFTSILEEDLLGFDNRSHDFEMLVLEDGHGEDTSVTPYYFYVELQ